MANIETPEAAAREAGETAPSHSAEKRGMSRIVTAILAIVMMIIALICLGVALVILGDSTENASRSSNGKMRPCRA